MSEEEGCRKIIKAMQLMREGIHDAAFDYNNAVVAVALSVWFAEFARKEGWDLCDASAVIAASYRDEGG